MAECILVGNGGGGGSSSADYITDGLIFWDKPLASEAQKEITVIPNPTFDTSSALTVEVAVRIDDIPASDGYARVFHIQGVSVSNTLILGLGKKSDEVGTSSDYGVNLWSGSSIDAYPKIPNLQFGDAHTFTYVCQNNTYTFYVDGIQIEGSWTLSSAISNSINKIMLMHGSTSNRVVTGRCCSFRWYSRALSNAEILQNREIDEQLIAE